MRPIRLWPLLLCLALAGCALRPAPPVTPTDAAITATSAPTAIPRLSATPAPVAARPTATPAATAAPALTSQQIEDAALRPSAEGSIRTKGMTEYRLTVNVAPDLSRLAGQEEIRYTNRETISLDVVYLHLYPNLWDDGMTVTDAQVAGRPVTVTYPTGDDAVGLPLDPPLAPGGSVDFSLRFAEPIPAGEGVGNYGEFALSDNVLAMAHFYPTVAVYQGGWRLETPAPWGDVIFHDASLYDVTFTAPADLTVVATGATLGRTENVDGSTTWRLGGGPMRDFNIVASKDYRSLSTPVGDITVNSYFLPQDEAGGQKTLDWAARALAIYQKEFGAYPYRELDVVATGTSAGGIEYPGMIVVAERLYGDPARQVFFESATVHEVAHQWWYNVVGNDQINHPWMDESLAQYSAYLYYLDAYGERGGEGFIEAMNARLADVADPNMPIGLPVGDYTAEEYSAIVYGRGPLFFLALRDRLGAEKMTEFLRRYYASETWQIATPGAFRALAEEVAGASLADLFQKWVGSLAI